MLMHEKPCLIPILCDTFLLQVAASKDTGYEFIEQLLDNVSILPGSMYVLCLYSPAFCR